MDKELKPCPFCGDKQIMIQTKDYEFKRVICCGCFISTEWSKDINKVIEAWNRRAR